MGHALCIDEICLLSSQFLRQQLLLCDVHGSAVVSLKNPSFNHRNSDTTDIPDLPIGPNYSARDIAVAVLLMHRLYGLCQGGSVLGMDRIQKLLNGRGPVSWIKPEYFVDLVRPIDV